MKERPRARLRGERGEQDNMGDQNSKRERVRVRQTEIKRSEREKGSPSEVAQREIQSKIEEERERHVGAGSNIDVEKCPKPGLLELPLSH